MSEPPSRRPRSSRWLPAAVWLASAVPACSAGAPGAAARTPRPESATTTFQRLSPARIFVLPDHGELPFYEREPDGTVRAIAHGLRFIERPNGSLEQATEVLPEYTTLYAVDLPERLGGGTIVYGISDETTPLWRTQRWTGSLKPLVTLPFGASAVTTGFDRIYALDRRTGRAVGLDAATGRPIDVGPLPASPAYGSLVFRDAWMAAVEAELRGVLVTFDAGASWRSLDVPTTVPGLATADGEIVVNSNEGPLALGPDGILRKLEGHGGDRLFSEAAGLDESLWERSEEPSDSPEVRQEGPLGPRPLARAVLRGVRLGGNRAVVADRGALAIVSLSDGRLLDSRARAYAEGGTCQGIRLGGGAGFVCGAERASTVVYEYVAPLELVPVVRFAEPRYVASSPSGTLLVRGGCDPDRVDSGVYCVIDAGRHREVRIQGDVGAERVAALSDGRIAVLVPPRFGVAGSLLLIEPDGRSSSRRLKWDKSDPRVVALLDEGLWLDGLTETSRGVLSAWVVGAGPFAGVRIYLDGRVTVGRVVDGIETAMLSGSLGLWLGPGELRETTDAGQTWRQVNLPRELAESVAAEEVIASGGERGCSPLGCAVGPWVRVGWGGGAKDRLRLAADPPPVGAERGFFVNWSMQCAPTGSSSPPVIGRSPRADPADRTMRQSVRITSSRTSVDGLPIVRNLTSGAWRPFLGVAAPPRDDGDLAFDFGTEDHAVQLRGYAWGPKEGRWDRAGRWLIRAVDRFDVDDAIWSTQPSRVTFGDALEAAQAFGSDPSRRSTTEWSLLLDPGGVGGLLSIRSAGETELAVVEKGRPITMVRDTKQFSLERVSGAVAIDGVWYVGTESNARAFHVLAIDGGRARLLGSFPRYGEGPVPEVVRTSRGDALGIWIVQKGRFGAKGGGDSWYIFPVDRTTGRASEPVVISAEQIGSAPESCDPDDDGWVVVHPVSASVANFELMGVDESVRANHVEVKLLVSADGVCADSIAARVEGGPIRSEPTRQSSISGRAGTPLSLTDRATDRRWGFRCAP